MWSFNRRHPITIKLGLILLHTQNENCHQNWFFFFSLFSWPWCTLGNSGLISLFQLHLLHRTAGRIKEEGENHVCCPKLSIRKEGGVKSTATKSSFTGNCHARFRQLYRSLARKGERKDPSEFPSPDQPFYSPAISLSGPFKKPFASLLQWTVTDSLWQPSMSHT